MTISPENWLIIEGHVGAENPNLDEIKTVFKDHSNHFHEKVENMYGDTLIHLAAGAGKEKLVKDLISCEVNEKLADVQNKFGFTPLHSALNSRQTAVAKLLIKLGANVKLEDYRKATALHIAAEKNNVDVIEELLKRSDLQTNLYNYLDGRDYNYDTPLHYAAKHDSVDALRYLISRGADIRKENLDKRTPILVAQIFESVQCFAALIAAGATPKGFNEKFFKSIVGVFNQTDKASNVEEGTLIELLFSYLQLMLKCNLLKRNIQMDPGDETIRSRYDEIKSKLLQYDSNLFKEFKKKLDDLAVKNDTSKCSIVAQSILKEFMEEERCKFCREKAKENRSDEIKFCPSLGIQFHKCAVQKSWKLLRFLTQIPKALVSETFDSVSDLVTAFENYGGQSKNFGLYEILNWFVMQVIESLLSAYTLFKEEKQQLEAQRGVIVCKKDVKSLNYHGIWWVHCFWLMFWPFRILRDDQDTKKSNGVDNGNEANITGHNTPKTFKRTYIYIYNILSAIVLPRSYGDKVLEYMHEPTTLWEIQHLKLRRRWLKQIPFILGKIPEFVIQFYTIQVLFNEDEKYQSMSFGQFFTDYNFLLRILSMFSICYRMPKSLVSLENNIRASDPVAQEMKTDCFILQMAYSIMLLARISLISTLLFSVAATQFGLYVGIRVACDWILNIGSCYHQDQY